MIYIMHWKIVKHMEKLKDGKTSISSISIFGVILIEMTSIILWLTWTKAKKFERIVYIKRRRVKVNG